MPDQTRATLHVGGTDLEPDSISKLLGCEPTRSHRRGELTPRTKQPWACGVWALKLTAHPPIGPEQLVNDLLSRLPEDPEVWRPLVSKYRVRLDLGIAVAAWNRGFELSSTTIRRVAALGLPLGVDIYTE